MTNLIKIFVFSYFLFPIYTMAVTDLDTIEKLASDSKDVAWKISGTKSYFLSQELADFYLELQKLESRLNEPSLENNCGKLPKSKSIIRFMIERDNAKEIKSKTAFNLDQYKLLMNKLSGIPKYSQILTFKELLLDYRNKNKDKDLDNLSQTEALLQLKDHLKDHYDLNIGKNILLENIMIDRLLKKPSDWKKILSELKRSSEFEYNDINHLVARIGQELLLNRNQLLTSENAIKTSVSDLLSAIGQGKRLGHYSDIARAQAQILEALGISSYIAYFESPFGKHAAALSINPNNPKDITQFNYDEIKNLDDHNKNQKLLPVIDPTPKIYDSKGFFITEIPKEIKERINSSRQRLESNYGEIQYALQTVELKVDDLPVGYMFSGITSDDKKINGVSSGTVSKEIKTSGSLGTLEVKTAVSAKSDDINKIPEANTFIDPLEKQDPQKKIEQSLFARFNSKEISLFGDLSIQASVSSDVNTSVDMMKVSEKNPTIEKQSSVHPQAKLSWKKDQTNQMNITLTGGLDPLSDESTSITTDTEVNAITDSLLPNKKLLLSAVLKVSENDDNIAKLRASYRLTSDDQIFWEGQKAIEGSNNSSFTTGIENKFGKIVTINTGYTETRAGDENASNDQESDTKLFFGKIDFHF